MAMENAAFQALLYVRDQFSERPLRMLCLGYPDLLVEEDVLRGRLGEGFIRPASDWERIARWHGWPSVIYDTDEVLTRMGIEATYIDIHPSREREKRVDLNEPWLKLFQDAFHIVFDGGTLEHCFSVGQAFKNIASSVKVGGYIIHTNPISQINHGFWNFNPTAYYDFYMQNGFDVLKIDALSGRPSAASFQDIRTLARVSVPSEVRSLVVVKKLEDAVLRWPIQSKYLSNSELKA